MKKTIEKINKIYFDNSRLTKIEHDCNLYKEEKIEFTTLVFLFSLMLITSFVTSLYMTGRINFFVEALILIGSVYGGVLLYKNETNKIKKDIEDRKNSKQNEMIKEALDVIKKENDLNDFLLIDLKKLVWLSEHPDKSDKEKEEDIKNEISNIKKRKTVEEPTQRTATEKGISDTPIEKPATTKTEPKKATTTKKPATTKTEPKKATTAKKPATTKAEPKKTTTAKKTAATKAEPKKTTTAKKTAATKTTPKKTTTAKKPATTKTTPKKTTTAKKPAATKTTTKKTESKK